MGHPKKRLTIMIEKLVSNIQTVTFAIRTNLVNYFKKKRVEEHIDKGTHIVKCRTKKIFKFMFHKTRVKDFLNKQLDGFSIEHATLFNLIEHGDVKTNEADRLLYIKCKHNIYIIIKTTRRISTKKITTDATTMSTITERIRERRFASNYNDLRLSTT